MSENEVNNYNDNNEKEKSTFDKIIDFITGIPTTTNIIKINHCLLVNCI